MDIRGAGCAPAQPRRSDHRAGGPVLERRSLRRNLAAAATRSYHAEFFLRTMPTAVKICGITRAEDAALAARLGAHALGFVFYRPSPRFVGGAEACAIGGRAPPLGWPGGLFVDAQQHEIEQTID